MLKFFLLDISIIIVSYNHLARLRDCLNSIYAQSGSASFEILVIDNASTDPVCDMVRNEFPDIVLIENSTNKGFAAANNQGLRIAQGDDLMLLNNDTLILDHAIEKMRQYLHEHPQIGLLGPRLLNANGSVQVQGSLCGHRFWTSPKPISTSFLRGAAWMLPRNVIENIGLLDEHFFFYNEDIDFCFRVKKAGYDVMFFPDADIMHYGGGWSWSRQWLGFQSSLYLWKKYFMGGILCEKK